MKPTRHRMRARATVTSALAATVLTLSAVVAAAAAHIVVVTPTNQQGWSTADTRPGGTVTFESDPTAPRGDGALQLTTDLTTTAKAQYLHPANTPLAEVTDLSYYTRQVASAVFLGADPSYQLVTCLNGVAGGVCNGFTTFVFEPYQNGVVVPNVWQQWDVDSGQFWSTRTVDCTGGPVVGAEILAGGGGAPFYDLALINTLCPDAVVSGFGVNIGTNNPGYVVRTDLFNFNGTVYDFELTNQPNNKDDCKNGGWMELTDENGDPFKNQGQCVKAANRGGGESEE